jgi:RND family efflux transporter MFP subunit
MISPISAGGSFTRTGICTIVDMDSREIEVDVNEAYINRVTAGQPVTARLDAYQDWEIPARVINIVPTADRQKATVRVRIAFEALDERILPDMGIKVEFMEEVRSEPEPRSPAIATLPKGAVRDRGGKAFVWVINGDTVERRAVSLGRQRAGSVEVIAGIKPGERVVIGSDAGLDDGVRVAIQ